MELPPNPLKVRFRPPLTLVSNTPSRHWLASDLIYCNQQPRGWQQTTCPNPPCYLLAPPQMGAQLYRLGLSTCDCQEVVSNTIDLCTLPSSLETHQSTSALGDPKSCSPIQWLILHTNYTHSLPSSQNVPTLLACFALLRIRKMCDVCWWLHEVC